MSEVGSAGSGGQGADAGVPTPPWRKPRRPVQVKQQLSQDLIVETGLHILSTEGFDALSMRRVAQQLDTGPASLYAHVANKDELLELVYDRVLGELDLPEPDPANWKEQLREYAVDVHRLLTSHADVARAALANVPTGPNALRAGEFLFGLLIEAGMTPRDASLSMERMLLYIVGDAYESSMHWAKMRASGERDPQAYMEHFVAQIADYYGSLPPERFPYMTGHVDALVGDDGDARFGYGLDLLLDGMEARMPKGPS
ncbi:TetR/AcrR family transcriptional regulator [Nonomuraea sp. NN258]|uniref:TetR/AcrR family transcriptional regulator n=1 Tax=Nonomuraea antri TaxID=2730852 RepID=UPI001567F48D|nr:TetR/AcrR family transcriptional regulator [Nonomuraea antri]NRQ38855.1 TetR/AcrR family transcriptional regulator [Nonomuraea antri]